MQRLAFGGNFNGSLDNVGLSRGLQQQTSRVWLVTQGFDDVRFPSGLPQFTSDGNVNRSLDDESLPYGLRQLTCGILVSMSASFSRGHQVFQKGSERDGDGV